MFYFFFLEENNFQSAFVCLKQIFSVIIVEEDLEMWNEYTKLPQPDLVKIMGKENYPKL